MSLEMHTATIKQFYQKLQKLTQHSHIQLQLLNILEHIQDNSNSFELSSCKQTPFYNEFINAITEQCIEDDNCFALLECLILFCREKQLRLTHGSDLPLAEQNILNFYEESDLWGIEDGTLLHNWYWHLLPQSCTSMQN